MFKTEINSDNIKLRIKKHIEEWMSNLLQSHDLKSEWESSFNPIPMTDQNKLKLHQFLNEPITIAELETTLKEIKSNSVSGPTRINYKMIKHLSTNVRIYLTRILNACLYYRTTLIIWLDTELIFFPKSKDWKGNLGLTHSIILLETFWKLYMKIIMNWLTTAIQQFSLLNSLNYVGLPGGKTTQPINTLQNIIEHVKKIKQEL